jgi:sugar/nucleoside kinase (ribokinase family)
MFERHVAGSEADTLAGLARLGFNASFISRVGDDEMGMAVLMELNSYGVDTSRVTVDREAPTGVYLVQRGYPVPGKSKVYYYRSGSAASRMGPDDIEPEWISSARLAHVTGITPALSQSCREAALRLAEIAHNNGALFSFDTNIRIQLLKTPEAARRAVDPFLAFADIVFTGTGDLDFLFGNDELEHQVEILRKLCPAARVLVVKCGSHGASAYPKDGVPSSDPGFSVPVVDELGAGDAFDAAFLACILKGSPIDEALMYANAAGAIAVTARGDLEPLPTWNDLHVFVARHRGGRESLMR